MKAFHSNRLLGTYFFGLLQHTDFGKAQKIHSTESMGSNILLRVQISAWDIVFHFSLLCLQKASFQCILLLFEMCEIFLNKEKNAQTDGLQNMGVGAWCVLNNYYLAFFSAAPDCIK